MSSSQGAGSRSRRGGRGRRRATQRPAARATGELLTLAVEKVVKGGLGLARHQGQVVLVADAAPGDRVTARVLERHRGHLVARVEEVLEPGPGRREPPCPHARRCGGCDLMHLTYPAQLEAKAAVLRESFARLGGVRVPEPLVVHPSPEWGYRLRARLHYRRSRPGRTWLGFIGRDGREVVDIGPCPVLAPELEARLDGLRAEIAARADLPASGEVAVLAADGGVLTSLEGAARGRLACAGETLDVTPGVFFQANRALLPGLVARVMALAGAAGRPALACDLYAGAGLFSLPLARVADRVLAVEDQPEAVALLRAAAARAGLANLAAVAAPVESALAGLETLAGAVVVADPARQGLSAAARAHLLRLRPRTLVYISCDPAAAARDVATLLAGGMRLGSLELFDLFPQTAHVEAVALLDWATDEGDPRLLPGS